MPLCAAPVGRVPVGGVSRGARRRTSAMGMSTGIVTRQSTCSCMRSAASSQGGGWEQAAAWRLLTELEGTRWTATSPRPMRFAMDPACGFCCGIGAVCGRPQCSRGYHHPASHRPFVHARTAAVDDELGAAAGRAVEELGGLGRLANGLLLRLARPHGVFSALRHCGGLNCVFYFRIRAHGYSSHSPCGASGRPSSSAGSAMWTPAESARGCTGTAALLVTSRTTRVRCRPLQTFGDSAMAVASFAALRAGWERLSASSPIGASKDCDHQALARASSQ